ncbi:MAG: ExeM/NucH family extracellular endonuclease [Woeseiaceae bacterium]|nr:ExeM/NucH family extracellular endonuclease [Woeseiaceae bacterium]
MTAALIAAAASCGGSSVDGSLEGVVTGDFQDHDADRTQDFGGFFIAFADADGDPATPDGILVDDARAGVDVAEGDRVRLTGRLIENDGERRFEADTVEITGTADVPTAKLVLPLPDNSDPERYLARFDGMRVTIAQSLTVAEHYDLERYGTLLLHAGGRAWQFTNRHRPDRRGFAEHQRAFARRSILLDDGRNEDNARPVRYRFAEVDDGGTRPLRIGDRMTALTGILFYGRDGESTDRKAYRLLPVAEPSIEARNERPAAPPLRQGALRVAGINALNLFATPDRGNNLCGPGASPCRGADSPAEYDRQLARLAATIRDSGAQVVGLMEVENDRGRTLRDLVREVSAATATDWRYIDSGVIGGDVIKVALIYDADRIEPVNDFRLLDSTVDPDFVDTKNRPSLAQTFDDRASGQRLTIVVNHLKSKGSDCEDVGDPDSGDGQGNCSRTRTRAAEALARWLATDPTASGDDDVLIIGDLNAYLREDPLVALEDAGFVNLLARDEGVAAYTYVFRGRSGALDHALASPALAEDVLSAFAWHVNADEARIYDYNLDRGRDPSLFDGREPYRSSDHDPVIVDIAVGE